MCVCVLLVTSLFGMSESWCGNVPTSDSDRSGPRLCRLLLCSLFINPPSPLILPSNVRTGGIPLLPRYPIHRRPPYRRTGSSSHLGVPRLCPSIPKNHCPARGPPLTWAFPVSINSPWIHLIRRFHSRNPPPLPCPCHAWQIPVVVAPSLPPKYLLTWPSAAC